MPMPYALSQCPTLLPNPYPHSVAGCPLNAEEAIRKNSVPSTMLTCNALHSGHSTAHLPHFKPTHTCVQVSLKYTCACTHACLCEAPARDAKHLQGVSEWAVWWMRGALVDEWISGALSIEDICWWAGTAKPPPRAHMSAVSTECERGGQREAERRRVR